MRPNPVFVLVLAAIILSCCWQCTESGRDDLYEGFVNPPAEARPFVRWWWNGNHITETEIKRQLDVLSDAGIGGVEINPIAMPEEAIDIGTKPLVWLSREWNELLALASNEARQRGMITDLIVGSGWPFGGEFVREDETIQRIMSHKIPVRGGDIVREDGESLYKKLLGSLDMRVLRYTSKSYEVYFIFLVPTGFEDTSEIKDLTGNFKEENRLDLNVPEGEYELVYGILERSVREVMHGAPGAAGPVMNHFERDITLAYLDRLKKISEDTGTPLYELIRALFCDSIELAGSNWTDGFEEIFFRFYGYRLEPFLPFVFYNPYDGYREESYQDEMKDRISRVRYDFNKLLVRVFNENFTRVFQDFCTENGLLCRYQAYGTPLLMGLMEGNMIPDIPESNNWIYSAGMSADRWIWNQRHGYMIWNLYAASGGHLTGRKIISNESMTNTRGVFKTSLDEIKQHDDMNFITGMNHAVLHGYNYSPPEAGFPGWIRYGSYFSEQNTWWPYFPLWVDYNARLSYIFQQTDPVRQIAILAPIGDIWSEKGLTREPFHTEPWYCYRLWEPISQAGSSCDYVSEEIIRGGTITDGTLKYGPMTYRGILLSGVSSMEPETASSLLEFVKSGGKLIVVDGMPSGSLSMNRAGEGDLLVRSAFAEMQMLYPDNIISLSSPSSEEDLLPWAIELFDRLDEIKDISIEVADRNVFQIRKKQGERDIFFFVNSGRRSPARLNVTFPTGEKTPWIWDPETGTRKILPYGKNKNELIIELQELESMLIIFEPRDKESKPGYDHDPETYPAAGHRKLVAGEKATIIRGPWNVRFEHADGKVFERTIEELYDFGTANNEELNTFAGTVTYTATFESDGKGALLELGEVNKGVTELFLNGNHAGTNWYGRPAFGIEGMLMNGSNRLEIRYTTVLSNWAGSLENNPTAERWTAGFEKIPMGLEGAITIYNN